MDIPLDQSLSSLSMDNSLPTTSEDSDPNQSLHEIYRITWSTEDHVEELVSVLKGDLFYDVFIYFLIFRYR